jgi:hypothetical protein
MKNLNSPQKFPALAFALLLAGAVCVAAQTPTLSVSPSTITNDYAGKIVLQIGNLTPGAKVIVQKYADLNANGVVDLGTDWLVQSFAVADGAVQLIGGVQNINVPADQDGATNGQIRAELNYPGMDLILDRIGGHYLFRLVDPQGVFTPVTAGFTVLPKTYPQGVTGRLFSAAGGQPVGNAVVVMVPPQGNDGIGAFTDANGNFSLAYLPGNYAVLGIKTGYVADQSAGLVSLSSGSQVTLNLTNQPGGVWLSGKVSDSGSGKGLPGVMVQADSTNNLMVLGFTDTNGNYNLPVTANAWKLKANDDGGLAIGGYVALQNNATQTATFGGSVSNLNFQFQKGTALVYGTLRDNLSNPVSGLGIDGQDNSYTYDSRGRTTTNGTYTVAVFAGNWSVGPSSDDLLASGLIGQAGNVTLTNGQALQLDLQVLRPTAHLRGRVVDGSGNPVGNQTLVAFLATTNGPSPVNLNLNTQPDGTFDIGVFGGSWQLGLECVSAAERGLVAPYIQVQVTDGVDQNNLTLQAPFATAYIVGSIQDNHGNPVNADVFAGMIMNGTNYTACGGNGGSTFVMPVFPGSWTVGISGDLTSLGYQNPPNQTVVVQGGTNVVNITLYPANQMPPRLSNLAYRNGQFSLLLTGDPDQTYRIDMTTNPANPAAWVPIGTNVAYGGTFSFTDYNATARPPRFYRAVLVQ